MRKLITNFTEDTLKPEVSVFGKLKNIIFGAVLYVIWAQLVFLLYGATIPEFMATDIMLQIVQTLQVRKFSPEFMFVVMCIFAPIFEELIYRQHLSIARYIKIPGILLYAVLISSLLFGKAHSLGVWSAPVQGVAGLIFCYVYIKNGYSYVSSVIMHLFINLYFYLS